MKKITILLFLFFFLGSSAQQILWSTIENSSSKYVSKENVSTEVLKFYDHYEFYYDGAGYDKNGFFKELNNFGVNPNAWSDFKKTIQKIDELTVFAIRSNSGHGSEVMVMFVTKNNVNIIAFTNSYKADNIITYSAESDRQKFVSWLETLKE